MGSQEPRVSSYDPQAREWSERLKSGDLRGQSKSPLLTNLQWLPIQSGLNCRQSHLQCGPKPPPACHLPLPLFILCFTSGSSPHPLTPSLCPSLRHVLFPQLKSLTIGWLRSKSCLHLPLCSDLGWHGVESCIGLVDGFVAWRQWQVSACAVRVCLHI